MAESEATPSAELAVAGIGAAAGGLEALELFFKAMPADSGLAFVLVLHLDPTHASHLVELLRRHTRMPVSEVTGGMRVDANHVYVIPPGAYLTISGKTLHWSEAVERRGLRLPIDFFFRSLAAEQQQRAIVVILSGSGHDGALGLREIKAQGGLVVVQDPQEAQYDGMPRAAIATGMADHVLKLQDMPRVLTAYVSHWYVNPVAQTEIESEPGYLQSIIAVLRANIRFDFGGYKLGTLTRRIQRRPGLHHIENPEDYVRLLRESPDEATALFKDLLIYLEPQVQKKIIRLFHFALREGGHLCLGNSETIGSEEDLFQPVCKKWRSYRRMASVRHERLEFPIAPRTAAVITQRKSGQPTPNVHLRLSQLVQQLVAERYSPACALINRQYEVLFLQGPVDRYLQLPTGELAADFLGMAREGLRAKLRALVREATRTKRSLTETAVRVKRAGSYYSVEISVEPIVSPAEAEGLLLVTFHELPQYDSQGNPFDAERENQPAADVPRRGTDDSVLLRQFAAELLSTRDELQATIEQQETFGEEMKAANEEVTSVNEELQSTNEELETSKEELQSTNEELTTVNSQLEAKIAELEATSNDLRNLLSSADMATIFLDRSLRIKRFTPAATKLLRLIPTDVGRPISDVVLNFTDEHLLSDAELVLRDLTPMQREVLATDAPIVPPPKSPARERDPQAPPRYYLRRLLPYRTEDDRIEGVVLTFADITDLKQISELLRTARDYAENIIATVREPLLVLDQDLRVRSANRAFFTTFGTTPQETNEKLFYELADAQWNIPELRQLLEDVLPEHAEFRDLEVAHSFARLGWRKMLLNARSILDTDGKPALILLAFEDVTDRFQRETATLALREQERVGRELHDSLGQQTTAIGMLAASLHRQLESAARPEAELAGKLLDRIEQAKAEVRLLTKGLLPVELDAESLMSALSELVENTREAHGVSCRFECEEPVTLEDSFAATHLFLIAKEAMHNAVKYAHATEIVVSLALRKGLLTLQVRDDGVGIAGDLSASESFGVRIMRYRAGLIGGNFSIEPRKPRGTVVICTIFEKGKTGGTA